MHRLQNLNASFVASQTSQQALTKTTIYADKKVAILEMTPPTKLIFLTTPLIIEVSNQLLELQQNEQVSVVILTGKIGSPSFATGANINEIGNCTQSSHMFDDYFEREWYRVIPKFRKPLIAAVNGYAFGGGLELAMMCDIIIASDKAKLG